MNKNQYKQPYAHNRGGFCNESITDSSHYGPMDQSIFGEEALNPGSHMITEAIFIFPVSPEPTKTTLQDEDCCSQVLETQLSHVTSSVQAGTAFKRRQCTKKEIAKYLLHRQEIHIQSDPKEKLRVDWNSPFVELDFSNIYTYLENEEHYDVMEGKDKDDGEEEGDLDVPNNLSQCGSDTNDEGSVTAKAKEPTGTRREAQKRCHSPDNSYDNSKNNKINEGSHT
ncbi:hypothetical protein O181_006384 [Austropuccinia psidii MF-1]|uniref:Uncharacterized protein n=1 Tax=Austropuccinia psidii MF-1 TaxID=1389203 RepID=A0A9Q3BK00_9BASI|nr:hypothetical protein [Austropuccinia psidii MF-1]